MARNDGVNRTVVRNVKISDQAVGRVQAHNEREKDSYRNTDIVSERTALNIHFKNPTAGYTEIFEGMVADGNISVRGLKPDAVKFCPISISFISSIVGPEFCLSSVQKGR